MAEITATITVRAWHIGTAEDKFDQWADLVQWCTENEGFYCSMAPQADCSKGIEIQVGSREHATVYPQLDSWVVFNGYTFEALSNEEFAAKYGQ